MVTLLFIWLHWVFVTAGEIFSCSMWDLVLDQRSDLGPLHWELGVLATGPRRSSLMLTLVLSSGSPPVGSDTHTHTHTPVCGRTREIALN